MRRMTRPTRIASAEIGRALLCLVMTGFGPIAAAESPCCYDNGSAGCGDALCEAIVCGADPFCCDVRWDILCARVAVASCGFCSGDDPCGSPGDCCVAHQTTGCDDTACCAQVCAIDPFCCEASWDVFCASDARQICGDCTPAVPCPGLGSCCEANGSPGCDFSLCCNSVCAVDPFCCDVTWDIGCALRAAELCGGACAPQCPGDGDCCNANGTAGCDDPVCCQLVCAADPACCVAEWDALCAEYASTLCADCGVFAGDCCAANGTPGCDDPTCQNTICAVDPFCCDTEWDQICADQAPDLCPTVCGVCAEPCVADLDDDQNVGVIDLLTLLGNWGQPGHGDIDCDDDVGTTDLLRLLAEWGPCP